MNEPGLSLFYKLKYVYRFPISLLCLEMYVELSQGITDEASALEVFSRVLIKSCGIREPTEEDVVYFMGRLEQINKDIQKENEKFNIKESSMRTFGSSYRDYIRDIPFDRILMQMTNYDLIAANRLYTELDRDDIMPMIAEYVKGKIEAGILQLDSCLYGFGGSYKEDQSAGKENVIVHDLQTEEGRAAMRSFGF